VQLIPAKLNFGTQPVGTRSLAKKITLTNKGSSAVKITALRSPALMWGTLLRPIHAVRAWPLERAASSRLRLSLQPRVSGRRMFPYTTTAAAARNKRS
jgi:hypothetical protein